VPIARRPDIGQAWIVVSPEPRGKKIKFIRYGASVTIVRQGAGVSELKITRQDF
jgi:hypothetical protein